MNFLAKNIKEKLQNIQLLAMDFDGVLTDNRVFVDDAGKEMVACSRSDSLGIDLLRRKRPDIKLVVISKETNPVVSARCKKLHLECISGIDNKPVILKEIITKGNYSPDRVAYIGNDINDLGCIQAAGIGIAVADSDPAVLHGADYITGKKGGCGAIREITDIILSLNTNSPS